MKAAELRGKTIPELKTLLSSTRRELFKTRLVKMMGEFKKTDELRTARKKIAKILTILTEKVKSHE